MRPDGLGQARTGERVLDSRERRPVKDLISILSEGEARAASLPGRLGAWPWKLSGAGPRLLCCLHRSRTE